MNLCLPYAVSVLQCSEVKRLHSKRTAYEMGKSDIQEVFQGAHVLITGSTGFIGQVILEKLLRSCHGLDRVYLLVRPKKGKTEEERTRKMFQGNFYDRLKKERPDFTRKITLITGDMQLTGLGLSIESQATLEQEVSIVYHLAATVRFDQKLTSAFAINIMGTKCLLDMAKKMHRLKAFIHISTAFSNCPLDYIDEIVYPAPMSWRELNQLVNSVDEDVLSIITPRVLGLWPNTYTFTKCIAEDLVKEYAKDIPVAIFRPSIVMSTLKEPLVCWTTNLYGAAGMAFGAAIGVIHTIHADPMVCSNMVPADMTVNAALAVTWDVCENWKSKKQDEDKIRKTEECNNNLDTKCDVPVFNFVCSSQNKLNWADYMRYNETPIQVPSEKCVWSYYLFLNKYKVLHDLCTLVFHWPQAFIIDSLCLLTGKEPQLIKGYKKINKFLHILQYFSMREWSFSNENVQKLWDKMNSHDQKLFYFDMRTVNWEEYIQFLLRGMRLYLLNESMENIDKVKQHASRLKKLHYITITFTALVASGIVFHFISPILDAIHEQLP